MKLDLFETHDRYKHFTNQNFNIGECCQNLIDQRPFGEHSFYIFAHTRTDEDGVTKRLIWQPRLTKPKSQTNSMLFKAHVNSDVIEIIWIIPDRCMWSQYEVGLIGENSLISESIYNFQFNREKLEKKDKDDLTDDQIDSIYKQIAIDARNKKLKEGSLKVEQIIKPNFLEAS